MTMVVPDSLTSASPAELPPVGQNDQYLAERSAQGDNTAFDEIVNRYQGRVAALAHRLLGWPGEVDDVVQDVFLSVLRNLTCIFHRLITMLG